VIQSDLVNFCFSRLPDEGTPVLKHVAADTHHELYSVTYILLKKKKVKWSRYRPGVTQRMGRGITLLFHDRGTRRRWVVSSSTRPHFTPGKDPVPILQASWTPEAAWTGGKSRPNRDSIPDRPRHSQSLYRLTYPTHYNLLYFIDRICWLIYCHTGFFTRSQSDTFSYVF